VADEPLVHTDTAEGAVAIGHDARGVSIEFGKPISWLLLTPDAAIQFARALAVHAMRCQAAAALPLEPGTPADPN
jgi:hypothetical protein